MLEIASIILHHATSASYGAIALFVWWLNDRRSDLLPRKPAMLFTGFIAGCAVEHVTNHWLTTALNLPFGLFETAISAYTAYWCWQGRAQVLEIADATYVRRVLRYMELCEVGVFEWPIVEDLEHFFWDEQSLLVWGYTADHPAVTRVSPGWYKVDYATFLNDADEETLQKINAAMIPELMRGSRVSAVYRHPPAPGAIRYTGIVDKETNSFVGFNLPLRGLATQADPDLADKLDRTVSNFEAYIARRRE